MAVLEQLHRGRFLPTAEHMLWDEEVKKHYRDHKVPERGVMGNTGVLVLSPAHHRDLFLHCYAGEDSGGRLYEQPLLSHEIFERDLAFELNARFNWGMQETLLLYVPGFCAGRNSRSTCRNRSSGWCITWCGANCRTAISCISTVR